MSTVKVNTISTWTGNDVGIETGKTISGTASQFKMTDVVQGDVLYGSAADTLSRLAPGTAGHHLQTGGAGANPSWIAAPAAGLSNMDQWQLTTSKTWSGAQSNVLITDTFHRQNFLSNSVSISNLPLGSGMTEATGVWTFPSTGFWLIITSADTYYSGANNSLTRVKVSATTDAGSNWGVMFGMGSNNHASYDGANSSSATFTPIDVTSVTNVKVRFVLETTTSGGLNANATGYMFIKIAET